MPIHRLLGSYRRSVPAYASSAVLPTAEAYARRRSRFKSRGWTAYKIHPPTEWERDIEICEAVRKAVGDDYRLMLDSTWSYDYVEALRVGQAVERLGYYWYEDPLVDDDLTNYVKLQAEARRSRSWPPSTRRAATRPTRPGSSRRRPTTCAATWR